MKLFQTATLTLVVLLAIYVGSYLTLTEYKRCEDFPFVGTTIHTRRVSYEWMNTFFRPMTEIESMMRGETVMTW